MAKRSEIVAAARDWLGTPYRHQGRDRRGIDCIGFTWAVARDLGYESDIPSNYSSSPSGNQLIIGCEKWLVRQERMQLIAGDIAIMWGSTRGEAQHFAIIGETSARLTLIHAWSKHQKVVEHGYDDFWERRLMAIYCLPDTTEG
ncbi:NlpC/P60 family protein [Hyphomicrobium sp.]|uniref:C40 family peptidase n=1 Tax=Hyphomicrobium sp. TaxID=82 RepID=UPI001D350FEB|nr:NlpC/P60 family protein [Hyphomicrobium sp.]MBY0560018.1 C40 family peptidase [Hyphomicrobium sp.]